MTDQFLFKLVVSFLVGGVWVGLTTVLAERFGTRLGGLLGGLPSTIVVSLYSIAWSQGAETAYMATSVIPMALAVNSILLTVYALTVERLGFWKAMIASLLAWTLPQSLLVIYDLHLFWTGVLVNILTVVAAMLLLNHRGGVPAVRGTKIEWSGGRLLLRVLVGGSVTAFAIAVSRLSGPLIGGIFAVFPAVILSTLVIAYRTMGESFTRSLIPTFMLSMAVNITVYVFVFRLVIASSTRFAASGLAYATSIGSGALLYYLVRRGRRSTSG